MAITKAAFGKEGQKNRSIVRTQLASLTSILILGSLLPGCRAIGAIFKAGVWVGVLAVVAVVAIIGGVAAMFRK